MTTPGERGAVADRREELLRRAEGVRLRWGRPERLALVGLGALLAGAVLPWGTDAAALPLWLGQASSPGTVLVGTALAAVAVPARTVAAWRWDRLSIVVGLAGAVAVIGTLAVQDVDGEPLPFLVPGRIVVLAGGVALVAAACGMAWVSAVRERTSSWGAGARWQALASDATAVDRVLAESRPETKQPASAGTALVAVAAGALALVGPWWRGLDVRGSYESVISAEPALDSGESAPTVRSGIELLGPAWSWAVAGAVLLAAAVVVWRGSRRGAPAVAAAGAFVLGVVAASTFHGQVERTLVPAIAIGALALGLAAALAAAAVAAVGPPDLVTPRAKFAGLLLVVVPGLVGATWSAADDRAPGVEMDGPYRVLVGGPDEADNVDEPAFDGAPGAETAARAGAPVWVGDLPGAVGFTDRRGSEGALALWVVQDDRVEVRRILPEAATPDSLDPSDIEMSGDMLFRRDLLTTSGVLRSATQDREVVLPDGTRRVAVGPHGELWMQASDDEGSWSPGAVYVATVDELADPHNARTSVDEWPQGPSLPESTHRLLLGPERAFVVLASGDRIVAVDDDGATDIVLGGVPDEACGLNRHAATSWVDPAGRPDTIPERPALGVSVAAADGGLWVALPTPDPGDERFELGRVDRDGTLRVVDHPLPGIRGIAPHPNGDAVLVVDSTGRLLELPDARAEAVPLPPTPDGCSTEEPVLAPPPRGLVPLDVDLDLEGILLDTAGTRLVTSASGDESVSGPVLTRVSPGGAEQVVADGRPGLLDSRAGLVADGAGGAWWLEVVEEPSTFDGETPYEVRLAHLSANGHVQRGETTLQVGPTLADIGLWADGDVAYVLGAGTISRVEGDRVDVVAEGPDVAAIHGRYDPFVVTRRGGVVVQVSQAEALVRLAGGRRERLLGHVPTGYTTTEPSLDLDDPPDDAPRRSLAVELDLGLPPGEVHIDGSVVPDPAGEGVLVLQDGLLVRVAPDGTITPLAQDPRLGDALRVLDGRLIVPYDGRSFTMGVPG